MISLTNTRANPLPPTAVRCSHLRRWLPSPRLSSDHPNRPLVTEGVIALQRPRPPQAACPPARPANPVRNHGQSSPAIAGRCLTHWHVLGRRQRLHFQQHLGSAPSQCGGIRSHRYTDRPKLSRQFHCGYARFTWPIHAYSPGPWFSGHHRFQALQSSPLPRFKPEFASPTIERQLFRSVDLRPQTRRLPLAAQSQTFYRSPALCRLTQLLV